MANWGLNKVQVIDVASHSIVHQIPVGSSPLKMWTAHNGQRLFVSNHDGNSVTVIDANTWQVITTVQVGVNPRNICTSMNDSLLYTANWGSSSVSVVDLTTYQVIHNIPVDYWPQAIWPTPDGRYILVANFGFDFSFDHISVIRTSDHIVIARLQTGAGPEDMITLGEDGQYLYVSNWGMPCCFYTTCDFCCSTEVNKGTMTVIAMPDFEAWVAPDSIPLEIPYIRSTLTTVPLQAEYSFGMARHPNGRYIFAVNMDSQKMSVIGLKCSIYNSFPISEDFDFSNSLPGCWSQQPSGSPSDWSISATTSSGGSGNEIMAHSALQFTNPGTTRLKTFFFNTTGISTLELSFNHFFDDISAGCTAGIQTSSDGINWTDENWSISSGGGNVGPELVITTLSHNLNSPTTMVAFILSGNLNNYDYWYIDNVTIKAPGYWVGGSTSNPIDWNTPANWGDGLVPTASTNVVVTPKMYLPVVNNDPVSPAQCNNLLIIGSAKVTVSTGKKLVVYGITTP